MCAVVRDDRTFCAVNHTRRDTSSYAACCPTCADQRINAACAFLPPIVGATPRSTTHGFYSSQQCVTMTVQPARLVWTADSVPEDPGASGGGAALFAHVGCEARWKVAASDPTYPVTVTVADGSALPPEAALTPVQTGTDARSELRWIPLRGTEGSVYTTCFTAFATAMSPGAWTAGSGTPVEYAPGSILLPQRCMVVTVRRCKYCPTGADTLLTRMRAYAADLNWLRLWAANGNDDNDALTSPVEDPTVLGTGVRNPHHVLFFPTSFQAEA